MRRNIHTRMCGYDPDGIVFTKTNVPGVIESSLLINQGDIYFGSTDGVVFKKSYPVSSEVRNELPMWGTFQGNNQRTGNQNNLELRNEEDFLIPISYKLYQNYPNPFNPITTLKYELPEDSFVDVTVYDILGNVVNNLINANQSSGYKSVQWDATNNQGEPVSAGVYLCKIQAANFVDTKKMICNICIFIWVSCVINIEVSISTFTSTASHIVYKPNLCITCIMFIFS